MKKGDMRRGELLATAERLFYLKGYEKTSVQDIITEMNFSKGGFYHHFDSKLSVLEAICEQRAKEGGSRAAAAAQEAEGATEKLNALLHAAPLWMNENMAFVSLLIQVAYRGDGALMREKMRGYQMENLRGPLTEILNEGLKEKSFFITDAPAVAEMIVQLYMQFTDEIAFLMADEENQTKLDEAMLAKLTTYRTAIERILIAPFGAVTLFDAKELSLLGAAVMSERIRRRADELLAGNKTENETM